MRKAEQALWRSGGIGRIVEKVLELLPLYFLALFTHSTAVVTGGWLVAIACLALRQRRIGNSGTKDFGMSLRKHSLCLR